MKPYRILTERKLRALGACAEQRKLFRERFGASVKVTEALCAEVSSLFVFGWAARHLLSATALAEYERITAPAWAEYGRVTASARAEYECVRDTTRAEYECVRDTTRAEYERIVAVTFARLYINEGE